MMKTMWMIPIVIGLATALAMAQSAKRAILQCQAYAFLPKEQYENWKLIQLTFDLKDML